MSKTRWQKIKNNYLNFVSYHPLWIKEQSDFTGRIIDHSAKRLYELMKTYKDKKRHIITFQAGYVKIVPFENGECLIIYYERLGKPYISRYLFIDEDSPL